MGAVGDDYLGNILQQEFKRIAPRRIDGIMITDDAPTSSSIVINPPNTDRSFMHCPGANDVYCADDINYDLIHEESSIFHFGYPPLMRKFYESADELASVFMRVKEKNILTSLDMVMVNSESEAYHANWEAILKNVLPYVDVFCPSIEEVVTLIPCLRNYKIDDQYSWGQIAKVFIEWGAKAVLLKMGKNGIFLKTSKQFRGLYDDTRWLDREWLGMPFREIKFSGTTGAGDTAIAGFLASMWRGYIPELSLQMANAVGTACVEECDALSGIKGWLEIEQRIKVGWTNYNFLHDSGYWKKTEVQGIYTH